jgi:PAS domain S-box-containing protein
VISGAQLRLVVTAPVVRRVLSIEGLDRLVSIYPSRRAAAAAGTPVKVVPAHLRTGSPAGGGILGGEAGGSSQHAAGSITPALLWQLIDTLGDGLAMAGEDGKIVLVNRRCAEMFGYQREELIGWPVDVLVPDDLRAVHPSYRAGYNRAPQARPMGERTRLVGRRKDGATIPVEISLSPVPTATEHFVLAVIRDASEAWRRDDLADLAKGAVAGQPRLHQGLLDRVVHRLFHVGLSLQKAAELPGDIARERLIEALGQLDDAIHEIRDYVFTSGDEAPAPLEAADFAGPG